jgi:hypothetical protein
VAQQQQHRTEQRAPEHQPAADATAHAGPGLSAVEAVRGTGEPAAASVAQILRAHPEEREQILTWLHQHRGNAFVQQVSGHLGQIEQKLPGQVDLKSVSASFTIPGKRKLGGNWMYAAKTREPTQVWIEVSTTGIRLSLSPGLYLDVDWPARDAELTSAGIDFASGKPFAHVSDGGGIGMIPLKGMIADKVTHMISEATQGTKLGAHYDPTHDPDLKGTLDRVVQGFQKLFHSDEHAGPTQKAPINPNEMKHVSAGATVALRGGAKFLKDGTGIELAAGAPLSISVDGAGDVGHLAQSHDAQSAVDALNVQAVHLSTEGLTVIAKGKPVAKISGITLARGGKVTIDSLTPLGKLAKAEAAESGLSLLFALIAARGGDGQAAGAAYQNAQRPVVVDGVSRAMIEQTFTETVHKMIVENRTAVPGLDLARALGIHG